MVVPDRIVQHERTIAIAPGIAGARVLFDDDRGNAELLEACAKRDSALSAADDDTIGLDLAAERRLRGLFGLEPVLFALIHAVSDPFWPLVSFALLEAFQLVHRGQQGPGASVLQTYDATPPRDLGLKPKPGFDHAIDRRRFAVDLPVRRRCGFEVRGEHRRDFRCALERLDVPSECDQIPPVALLAEQRRGGADIARSKRRIEFREPGFRLRPGIGMIRHPVLLSSPFRRPMLALERLHRPRRIGRIAFAVCRSIMRGKSSSATPSAAEPASAPSHRGFEINLHKTDPRATTCRCYRDQPN